MLNAKIKCTVFYNKPFYYVQKLCVVIKIMHTTLFKNTFYFISTHV